MIGLLILALYSFACLAAGITVLRVLGTTFDLGTAPPAARVLSGFIVGQGVLSQVLVVIGLAGSLTTTVAVTVPAVFLGIGGKWTVQWLRALLVDCRAALKDVRRAEVAQVGIALLAVMYALVLGSAGLTHPPWGDAEAFYFAYPKFIAAGGRLVPFTGSYEGLSSIGLLGELNYAALMLLAGPRAAKLFAWVIGMAAILMLVEIGRLAGSRAWGRITLAVMALTSTAFALHTVTGKVDLFAAALGLCAAYWALSPAGKPHSYASARIAGVAAGLACVAKLSYAPTLLPSLVFLLVLRGRGTGTRNVLGDLGNFAAAALVAVAPHLLKNALFFGEPLAPFITSSSSAGWHESNRSWYGPDATRWIALTYPLALVFGKYPMQEGTVSFLWLAFIPWVYPLCRWAGRVERTAIAAGLAGTLGVAIWVVLRPSVLAPRYYLASLLLLFVPVALGVDRMMVDARIPRLVKRVSIAVLGIALLAHFAPFGKGDLMTPAVFRLDPLSEARRLTVYVRGLLPECDRASSLCAGYQLLNREAIEGERVYVASYYSYWLRSDLMVCRSTAAEESTVLSAPDDTPIWELFTSMGFRYVLVHTTTSPALARRLDEATIPSSMKVDVLPTTGPLRIFRVTSKNSDSAGRSKCEWLPASARSAIHARTAREHALVGFNGRASRAGPAPALEAKAH